MGFLDELDTWFEEHATTDGVIIEILIVIYCFFALAIICDEHMAPALETLCIRWGIREDVAGATFLAFGSAAPEIVINCVTTIKSSVNPDNNQTSLGISAIIGSGMIAFSFIPAMCAFFSELQLSLKRRPLFRDEVFYLVALFTLCAAFHDGKIVWLEALFLICCWITHLLTIVSAPFLRKQYRVKVKGIKLQADESFVHKKRRLLEEHRSQSKLAGLSPKVKTHEGSKSMPDLSINPSVTQSLAGTAANDLNDSTLPGLVKAKSQIIIMNKSQTNGGNSTRDVHNSSITDYGDDDSTTLGSIRPPPLASLQSVSEVDILKGSFDETEIKNDSSGSEISEDEEEMGALGKVMHWITMPLQLLFKFTCPPAGEKQSCERLYGLTFFISVCWVAVFSYLLSSIVGAWVKAWEMPQALFGMLLIAVGAEIPDTIESVTMARKAYGSMAVSNCQGTQVINIGIGLGLPWLLTAISGTNVKVDCHQLLQVAAFFQTGVVCLNFMLLLGYALATGAQKAVLTKGKAILLILIYFCATGGFSVYLAFEGVFTSANGCPYDNDN